MKKAININRQNNPKSTSKDTRKNSVALTGKDRKLLRKLTAVFQKYSYLNFDL